MQVLCVSTKDAADIKCQVCGHSYKLYFSRPSKTERAEAIARVEKELAEHHAAGKDHSVHPGKAFNVPAWSGKAEHSAAALLGGAPTLAA